MSDFLRAWPRIDPAFGPATVDAAFERAKGRAPLPELAEYGPRVHLLANLCRELQAATGDAPFFLAARTAGKLLECDPTPAWRVLDLLEEEKMLECVEEGTPGRAARYRWIGPTN